MEDVFERGNTTPLRAMLAAVTPQAHAWQTHATSSADAADSAAATAAAADSATTADPTAAAPLSHIDWARVAAAAVSAAPLNAHAAGTSLGRVTWAQLGALVARERLTGDCAAAVAMEATLDVAQRLCVRYGYLAASCQA